MPVMERTLNGYRPRYCWRVVKLGSLGSMEQKVLITLVIVAERGKNSLNHTNRVAVLLLLGVNRM